MTTLELQFERELEVFRTEAGCRTLASFARARFLTFQPPPLLDFLLDCIQDLRFNPAMQTLGLSDSMPRSESRLKSLFWPSIQSSSDVDYLGAQGYWVCAVIAVLSFVVLLISDHPFLGGFVFLVFYLGGVGVRERSRYAAGCVLVLYVMDMLVSGPHIIKVLFAALLLANFRAIWIASHWRPDSEEAVPAPRWSENWSDKFADQLPMWLGARTVCARVGLSFPKPLLLP